jgi:nucleoside-diphosphate-sugar epimerase
MNSLFCFGFGYTAETLARRLQNKGWRISGTSTTKQGTVAIEQKNVRGFLFDGTTHTPHIADALRDATHVLSSIPPTDLGDPAAAAFAEDIAASPNLRWIGYLSTVGVYGDTGGAWLDETREPRPAVARSQRRLDAENQWRAIANRAGKQLAIFRLPAIYGPGRSVIEELQAGKARRIIKPGQVFNRIHVADIATVVETAMAKQTHQNRVYNVVDDLPAPQQDVIAYAAELLDLPCPPDIDFETAELTPMTRSFYSECKRVSNTRIKNELGVSLAYPTYREGLRAIADGARRS